MYIALNCKWLVELIIDLSNVLKKMALWRDLTFTKSSMPAWVWKIQLLDKKYWNPMGGYTRETSCIPATQSSSPRWSLADHALTIVCASLMHIKIPLGPLWSYLLFC